MIKKGLNGLAWGIVWLSFSWYLLVIIVMTLVSHSEKSVSESEKVAVMAGVQAPKIALTFDDGPNPEYTEKLLDGLKERNVRVTFFVLGECVEMHPEIVERAAKEGHLIGNHSYKHEELSKMPVEKVCAQLCRTYNMIYELTGRETVYVRPPYGAWKSEYDCNVNMIPVFWTIDTLDWSTDNVDAIVNRVVNKEKENDIILMHDCYPSTLEAAWIVIDYLKGKGYDLVTVDEIVME